MLSSNEPLLSASPYQRNASPCRPVLLITLSSAALLCAGAAFLLLNLSTPDLCASSPDPTSCHAIVADTVLASPRAHPTHPAVVLRAIVARSLVKHDAAAAAVSGMLRRVGSDSDPRQRSALADCVQLMDLARDRLADASPAVAAAPVPADDARTWLSAALTYYATCTDGVVVDGPLRDAVGSLLEPLKSLASASLAVLSAVGGSAGSRDAEVAADTYTLPSWVPARDRALLEAGASGADINADVVVAQDGSGRYNVADLSSLHPMPRRRSFSVLGLLSKLE